MNVKLVNIQGAEDKDKNVFVDGQQVVGSVYRGWLRTGGEQWVFSGIDENGLSVLFGDSTLSRLKREISRRSLQVRAAS